MQMSTSASKPPSLPRLLASEASPKPPLLPQALASEAVNASMHAAPEQATLPGKRFISQLDAQLPARVSIV